MNQLIRRIITAIFGKKQAEGFLLGYVAKNSVQLFIMHCAALLLGFVSNYILIKVAGVAAYGSYVYIFNFLYLLTAFCIIGTDTLLVKKIAVSDASSDHSGLKGVIFFSWLLVVAGAVIISVISSMIASVTGIVESKALLPWQILSLLSLVMLSVIAVNQASLQGLKRMFFSQVTEKIIRPVVVIVAALIFSYGQGVVFLEDLVWINVAAIAVALCLTFILLWKSLPFKLSNVKAKYDSKRWINAAFSFLLLDILYMLNARADVFMLGLYRPNEEVAVYNIALRISEVISFGLVIINFVLAPIVAALFEQRDMGKLQQLITRSARIVLYMSLPLAILIIVFRQHFLSFFDVNLLNGSIALLILCIAQLVNVLCGSVGLLLIMTGHQKFSILSLSVGTGVNIILNLILIPRYGLMGAAIATGSSLVLWNLMMLFFVNRKLNIRSTAFGNI